MNPLSRERLDFLRRQYPKGSRIRLGEMKNDPWSLKPGSMGTLDYIDDIGTLHVKWDDGRGLGLVLGVDSFTVLPPLQTLKLYMPMTATHFGEEDDMEIEITMDSREAVKYAPQIIAALQKERAWMERHADAERGIMAYYYEEDSVAHKVKSCHFAAEVRDGQLWGVAECRVQGKLTPDEMELLMEAVAGQASDGIGESLEQRGIDVGGLEIFVHLWQDRNWSIMTEQDRFDPRFSERLPDICWSTLSDDRMLVCIRRGKDGYSVSKHSTNDPEINRCRADYFNQERGISRAQEQAMAGGCLYGWNSPAAVPKAYEQQSFQMGGMQQ